MAGKLISRLVARPDFMRLPELLLPFYVRSAGYFNFPSGHIMPYMARPGYVEIFWVASGDGEIILDQTPYELKVRDVLWKIPSEGHGYRAGKDGMEIYWFTFDGPGAEAFMTAYDYPRVVVNAGSCPVTLFDEMESGLREMSPYSQRHLIGVAAEILALAGRTHHDRETHGGRLVGRFIDLAQKELDNPLVNVNTLADWLGIHRSTLSRYFQEQMLMSPGDYLTRLRLQRALSLLRETDLPINEVAEKSGIPDRSYFCRAIRRATGMSPRQFRAGERV